MKKIMFVLLASVAACAVGEDARFFPDQEIPPGDAGDVVCGDETIAASEWHQACGSAMGSCRQGQVQCRFVTPEGSEEAKLARVCYGEVAPATNSAVCDVDADCDGSMDDTSGAGENVAVVSNEAKLCRNAVRRCLTTEERASAPYVLGNGEGVLEGDFVVDANEFAIGNPCVASGGHVLRWQCELDADGFARVTCTGTP